MTGCSYSAYIVQLTLKGNALLFVLPLKLVYLHTVFYRLIAAATINFM